MTPLGCVLAPLAWVLLTGHMPLTQAIEFDHEFKDLTGDSPRVELFAAVSPGRPIPEEPPEYDRREMKAFYDWRNDLFFRHFDMEGTGRADFMTARRTYRVWLDEFGTPVVLTMANPLFYWVDVNANGKFEPERGEMWSDPEEDGVNGNERLYDVSDLQDSRPPPYPYGAY